MTKKKKFNGKITIIGKSNVGKSTLLNKFIKKEKSIISYKINTTKKNIKGIITKKNYQYIFIDTPGLTKYIEKKQERILIDNINKSEIIIFLINLKWNYKDEKILNLIKKKNKILLVINKIDKIKKKNILLPYLNYLKKKNEFTEIIPISCITGENFKKLFNIIKKLLPEKKHKIIKKEKKYLSIFRLSEIIREQLLKKLYNEVPYNLKIFIKKIIKKKKIDIINVVIIVKKNTQKKILIGKNANMIKKIGILSRKKIEKKLKKKIYLNIKIKKSNNKIIK